jgi:hypothetical protein
VELYENNQQTERYKRRVKSRFDRNRFREKPFSNKIQVSSLFETDIDLRRMRRPFQNPKFYELFESGFRYYQKGSWSKAKVKFFQIASLLNIKDAPTSCLMSFMQEHDFQPPLNWEGCRTLNDK